MTSLLSPALLQLDVLDMRPVSDPWAA